jgi:hypothetical protein
VSESLAQRLDSFARGILRADSSLAAETIFATRNYLAILSGLNFKFGRGAPILEKISGTWSPTAVLESARLQAQAAAAQLPDHEACLRSTRG